jgi:hypothetical protein
MSEELDRRILEMSEDRLESFVKDLAYLGWQPAAALLMHIYKLCDGQEGRPEMRALVMSWIRHYEGPAVRRFILRELRKHQYDWLGDWAIIALVGSNGSPSDSNMLADLFEDPKAIDSTKESAVKGMSTVLQYTEMRGDKLPASTERRAREVAAKALQDPYPETRISGIWLASTLGGFEEKLRELAMDDHALGRGCSVAAEARMHLGIEEPMSEKKKRRKERVAARSQEDAISVHPLDS